MEDARCFGFTVLIARAQGADVVEEPKNSDTGKSVAELKVPELEETRLLETELCTLAIVMATWEPMIGKTVDLVPEGLVVRRVVVIYKP